ncbi:hypothetical protein [Vibrio phage phiKT1019]|nr:hypothetical protein [Vibrio phage phiKT1019]
MFKKLSSSELQHLSPKDLESYQLELMKHEKFNAGEYLEHNKPKIRQPNKPLYRPILKDEEDPSQGWEIVGILSSEFEKFKDGEVTNIVNSIKEELQQGELVGEVGARPDIDFSMYKATLEGVKGYKQLIRGHFSLKENRVGFRVLDIRMGRSGVHITFIPHGPLAEIVTKWIEDKETSFRMYPRLGYDTNLQQTFITFDLDKENLMP